MFETIQLSVPITTVVVIVFVSSVFQTDFSAAAKGEALAVSCTFMLQPVITLFFVIDFVSTAFVSTFQIVS